MQLIPDSLLAEANRDRWIKGFVDKGGVRTPVVFDGEVVGFITVRESRSSVTLGPNYVKPSHRRRGLCREALAAVLHDLAARGVAAVGYADDANPAGVASLLSAGMKRFREARGGAFYRPAPLHKLICGDVTRGAVGRLMGDAKADIVYTDPPWGPGNLGYWRTKSGVSGSRDWSEFLASFASAVASRCDGPIFIEMGVRWVGELVREMASVGVACSGTHTMDYGKPARPQVLCAFSGGDVSGLPRECWAATREVASRHAVNGGVLLDPCLGLGESASVFAAFGMRVHGCELSATRLATAAKRLIAEVSC